MRRTQSKDFAPTLTGVSHPISTAFEDSGKGIHESCNFPESVTLLSPGNVIAGAHAAETAARPSGSRA